MSLSERDGYIALNSLSAIGVNNFHNLLERFGSVSEMFGADRRSLATVDGIGPKSAEQIISCTPQKCADAENRKAEKLNVKIVTLADENYPLNLKKLFNSPPVIYMAGGIRESDAIAIGVVGARKPTPYGRIVTENISAALSARGFTIISGMARGIDGFAHRTAMEAGGRTIAVMGSGLDCCYPPEHKELYEKITEHGAVISQFSFGTGPEKRNFPMRNRIISGLSLGLIVTEAGEKSGALITAYAALEEGREVFAVPGRIDSAKSAGTNRLIQKGAKLVTTAEDVIEEFPPEIQSVLEMEKSGETGDFSAEEEKLITLLGGQERHVDYLIEKSGLPSGVTLGLLLEMEIKGAVRQLPGKLFARSR